MEALFFEKLFEKYLTLVLFGQISPSVQLQIINKTLKQWHLQANCHQLMMHMSRKKYHRSNLFLISCFKRTYAAKINSVLLNKCYQQKCFSFIINSIIYLEAINSNSRLSSSSLKVMSLIFCKTSFPLISARG